MIMKRKFDYYFIRLLHCALVMVTKEYFDWFLIHGKDLANDIDVIITESNVYFDIKGSVCAYQIQLHSAPNLVYDDDLPF